MLENTAETVALRYAFFFSFSRRPDSDHLPPPGYDDMFM